MSGARPMGMAMPGGLLPLVGEVSLLSAFFFLAIVFVRFLKNLNATSNCKDKIVVLLPTI